MFAMVRGSRFTNARLAFANSNVRSSRSYSLGWCVVGIEALFRIFVIRISKSGFRISLLISKRGDRIETRGRPSRGETGEQTRENRHAHTHEDEAERKLDRKRGKRLADTGAHYVRKTQSDKSAEQTQGSGFDQELKKDRAPPGAQSFARSDFARALFHAHKRDIHYPDCADKKRKASNKKPGDGDGVLDWIQRAFQRLLFVDAEVVFFLWRQAAYTSHDAGQLVFRFGEVRFVLHFYQNVGIAFGAKIFLECWQRHHDNRIQTEQS